VLGVQLMHGSLSGHKGLGNDCLQYSRVALVVVRCITNKIGKIRLNPDSAVEREVMSKEQTFRSKDNAFCL
jgi:hypothetical protein